MSIRIGPQGQTWVQRPIGEAFDPQYCVEKEKHAPKVHVWGCMSAAGVGAIHVFTENLDAVLMKKILKEHLMKSANKFLAERAVAFPAGQRSKAHKQAGERLSGA